MKRFVTLLICVFTLLIHHQNQAMAQLGIRTGLKLGRTQSKFTGSDIQDVSHLKANTGGVSLELNLLVLSFQADLLYQSRGTSWNNGEESTLHYICIPVVVKKKFLPLLLHPYVLAGPEWNYLLSGDIDIEGVNTDVKKSSMGIVVGAGLEFALLGKAAYVEGRYHYGIDNISKTTALDIKNRTMAIYLGLLL